MEDGRTGSGKDGYSDEVDSSPDLTELEDIGRGGIVTARGTSDGLTLRLDGRVGKDALRRGLDEFVSSRRSFLAGHDVVLEWVGEVPEPKAVADISAFLLGEYGIAVSDSVLWAPGDRHGRSGANRAKDAVARDRLSDNVEPLKRAPSLFDGIEALQERQEPIARREAPQERTRFPLNDALWDEPDARIIYSTLRSGQKIETEHSLIVFGDVNSGAELVAGGDIIVLGNLRGIAHAGAYDETGGGRVIFALNLQPTQLRIGMIISRGSSESGAGASAELARVEGNLIVVEPYAARSVLGLRRR